MLALHPVDTGYDGDGDGKSDQYGLNPVVRPGTESLAHPGQVGTAWVGAVMNGDAVSQLVAEAGDFHDE